MGGKVCLRCKGKTLLDIVNKLFVFKSLLTMPINVLPLHLKQTFPPIIWILFWRWRWWYRIQATFENLFYFDICKSLKNMSFNPRWIIWANATSESLWSFFIHVLCTFFTIQVVQFVYGSCKKEAKKRFYLYRYIHMNFVQTK